MRACFQIRAAYPVGIKNETLAASAARAAPLSPISHFKFLFASFLLLVMATPSWSQSLGVSFIGRNASPADNLAPGDVAGVVPQPNWNNIDSGTSFSGTTGPLTDNSGNATSITLTYSANDSWSSDGGTATPNERLMKGIIKANPGGATSPPAFNTMTFVFNNVPNGSYSAYVYAMENVTGAKMSVNLGSTTYYIAEENIFNDSFVQATSTNLNNYQDANFALFNNISPAGDGTITITCTKFLESPQLNDGAGVAGIQLVPAGTPIAPFISTPQSQSFLEAPLTLQLTATIRDDGYPLPANPVNPDPNDPNKLRWGWTVVSIPPASSGVVWSGNTNRGEAFTYQGSPNPPWTLFTSNPTATFDVPGSYVLSFWAFDGQLGSTNQLSVFIKSTGVYRQLGYAYLSPIPNAEYTSPQTRFVLVRFNDIQPSALTNLSQFIQVTGVSSGAHAGTTRIASDNRTVIFQMSADFTRGELVTVHLNPGVAAGNGPAPYQYQFIISTHMPDPPTNASLERNASADGSYRPVQLNPGEKVERSLRLQQERAGGTNISNLRQPQHAAQSSSLPLISSQGSPPSPLVKTGSGARTPLAITMSNGVSVPGDFPFINITTNNNPDPDYIFLDNRGGNGHPYNVIFDNSGSPIWYSRYPDERRDMKVQHNGVLTMLARDQGGNHFNGFNTNYQQITQYWAVNGYGVDEHELQVFADGSYMLVALRTETVDMSRYVSGGNPAASVTEEILQEFTAAGDLIFQWRAWDNFDIRDQQTFINLTSGGFDFPHMNSLDVDTDGNILLSSRSTSECTKINSTTGQMIWRMGGAHGDLTFINDPLQGTRNQHALRSIGTNRYTIFDNGDQHSPSESRAVEYVVDPTNKTATLVWQYPATPTSSLYSFYMGDVQRLTNGNTLIDWAVGNLPKLTEVRPDGFKAFEMNWVNQYEAYRVWRCPWRGVALQPYLILEPYPDNLTLIFNQFGDTNIAYYKIYGGSSPHPTTVLATSGTTLKSLSNLQNGLYYFRVTAVNKQGVEGQFSNEENVTVNIIKPGQNMLSNGDFSQASNSWTFTLAGGAAGAWRIESGVSHFDITNGGTSLTSIQLVQTGKALIQGKKYVLQFDAWSDQTRYIDVKLQQAASPFTDYSKITSPFLTPTQTRYQYVFTMTSASDFSANLVFNLGSSAADVFLDNIYLFNPSLGDLNTDTWVDFLDLGILSGNWLKQQSGLNGDLDTNNKVDFFDFGILGENWFRGGP